MLGTGQEIYKSPYKIHPTKVAQHYTRQPELNHLHVQYMQLLQKGQRTYVWVLRGPHSWSRRGENNKNVEITQKHYSEYVKHKCNVMAVYQISLSNYFFPKSFCKYLLLLLPSTRHPTFNFYLLCCIEYFYRVN